MNTYPLQKATSKSWIVWLCAVLFYFYEFMIQVSPGVIAQDLMRDFNIHATDLGNLSAYYFYSYASMQLVVGIILDSWGPRKLLSTSSIVCALGCYLFAQADSLIQAELSRFLIGAGSACAVISSFKLATSWFPSRYFGIMTGLTVMTGMLGAVFGEAPLAWIVQLFGWRHAMLGFSVSGIALAMLIWTVVRDVPNHNINQVIQKSVNIKGSISTIFKCRQTWLASIYGGLMFAPTTALGALWGVSWMCTYYSLDRATAAHIVSFLFFGWAVGSPLSGVLTNYFGRCKATMQGGTIFSFLIICSLIFVSSWSHGSLKALWFMFGLASSGFLPFMTIIRRQHSYQTAGTAMGFGNGMNMVGGALLQPIIGLFLDQKWNGTIADGVRSYTPSDYTYALTIVPILIAVSYIILLMIKEEGQENLAELDSSSNSYKNRVQINVYNKENKMIKTLAVLVLFGSCLWPMSKSYASDPTPDVPAAEEGAPQYKLYAVVDEKLNSVKRADTIAHMALELGSILGSTALRQTPYISADDVVFNHISECPFMVKTAKPSKLEALGTQLESGTIPHVKFSNPKLAGIGIFTDESNLPPLVKSFSLLRASKAGVEEPTCEIPDAIPHESAFFALIDESLPVGLHANALGHMSVGLGSAVGAAARNPIVSRSSGSEEFNPVTEYPYFIIKSKTEEIRAFYTDITADDTFIHAEFLDTMHLGPTYREQIAATREKPFDDLRILGVSVFGQVSKLLPLVIKSSLLK